MTNFNKVWEAVSWRVVVIAHGALKRCVGDCVVVSCHPQGGPYRELLTDIFDELRDIAVAVDSAQRSGKSDPGLCGAYQTLLPRPCVTSFVGRLG